MIIWYYIGIISPSFVLQDFRGRDMCLRHLKLECPDHLYCTHSHETISYDRLELGKLILLWWWCIEYLGWFIDL